jgi:membrane associated rhomboid family serine protease/Flp pilus assembly protein TadD
MSSQILSVVPRLRPPTVTVALLVAMCVVFAMATIAGGSSDLAVLVAFGANFGPLVTAGDTWRLVASIFLHAGALHLVLNAWALFVLGRNLEAFYGPWRFLAIFLLSGLAGAAASAWISQAISVGASGGIFGLLGASIVFAFRWRATLPRRVVRTMGTALLPWVALNVVLGFLIPRIDIAAHLGGLVAGAVLAAVIVPDVIREARGLAPPIPRMLTSLCASLLIVAAFSAGENIFRMRGPDGAVLDPRVVAALAEMDRESALANLHDALEREPNNRELLSARADLQVVAGNWEQAVADYRAALAVMPDDARALNNLAWLLLEEAPEAHRDRAEAARLAARAAELAPDDPYVLGTLGVVRLREGELPAATALLEHAVAAERPRHEQASDHFLLAVAYARSGRPREARRALRDGLRADADNRYRAEAESAVAAADPAAGPTQSAPAP